MKKLVFILCLILVCQTFAASLVFKGGTNYTWFSKTDSQSELCNTFGVGFQFPQDSLKKVYFCIDVLVAQEITNIKNLIYAYNESMVVEDELPVRKADWTFDYKYLKIPFYFRWYLKTINDFTFVLDTGACVSWTLFDQSSASNRVRLDNDQSYQYTFDEHIEGILIRPADYLLGIGLNYKFLNFDLVYTKTFSKTKRMSSIDLHDHLETIRFMLTFKLNLKS